MIGYKITTAAMTTRNDTQWVVGEPRTTSGEGKLCGPGWLHFYPSVEMALVMNPVHGKFDAATMRIFECRAEGKNLSDHGLKVGATSLTLTREIARADWPVITSNQRIAFGIRCALEVYDAPGFVKWAQGWLDGSDRSAYTADAAARAAADAAADAVASGASAASGARAASGASGARAASGASGAYAAPRAAARAAYAAYAAADSAADAVDFTECLVEALAGAGAGRP